MVQILEIAILSKPSSGEAISIEADRCYYLVEALESNPELRAIYAIELLSF